MGRPSRGKTVKNLGGVRSVGACAKNSRTQRLSISLPLNSETCRSGGGVREVGVIPPPRQGSGGTARHPNPSPVREVSCFSGVAACCSSMSRSAYDSCRHGRIHEIKRGLGVPQTASSNFSYSRSGNGPQQTPSPGSSNGASDGAGNLDGRKPEFRVKLFAPNRRSLELPEVPGLVGDSRWVVVNTDSGYQFKVFMKRMPDWYELCSGWELLVGSERLQDEQIVRFELSDQNTFVMWSHDTRGTSTPAGFSIAQPGGTFHSWGQEDYIIARGTELNSIVEEGMNQMWAFPGGQSKMYVCTIAPSQLNRNALFFSAEYSMVLPTMKHTIALRLIGSPVIIPGSIRKYNDGIARTGLRGWQEFVNENHICAGEVFIFRFFRGPSAWELLGCRSRVMVV